jgi:importin subunit alpha-1
MVGNLIWALEKGEWNVQKEAVWAVSNMITSGGEDIVHYSVDCSVLKPLVKMMKVEDTKILQVAMEAVTTILEAEANPTRPGSRTYAELVEEAGGVDVLDALQDHASADVYEKATDLIERFFGGGDAEAENTTPALASSSKAFTFGSTPAGAAQQQPGAVNVFGAPAAVANGTGFSFNFLSTATFK